MGTYNRARLIRLGRGLTCAMSATGIASCVTTLSGPAGSDEQGPGDVSTAGIIASPNDGPLGEAGSPPCGAATREAQRVLESYCTSCHGADSAGAGGFDSVVDVAALTADGKVVPFEPDSSPLYTRMLAETMPPASAQKRPSEDDIKAVGEWITCGAPAWDDLDVDTFDFVSIDTRLRLILDDLRSFQNPADRQRMRYLDLTNLANAGYSREQVRQYRQSIGLLVNSLSRGRAVVAPAPIDEVGLLLRIDMRDYEWDAQTWQLLESDYPYAVRYDPNSRLFPFDEVTAEQIRRETGATVPYLQADWFLSHASRPPLYHDILELPETLSELEDLVGVDIDQDVASGLVSRAAFQDAGPSQNHRAIQRHELSGNRGALWVSYDFASNVGDRNVFANPLDFEADGVEVAFNLDNGLLGYFLADAEGRRQDKAERDLLQDPLARDGAVENGLSCMNCHQADGILAKNDEVLPLILQTGDAQQIEEVLTLYPDNETLNVLFAEDQNRYRSARSALSPEDVGTTTFHNIDRTHQGVLDLDAVASILGIEAERLERALDASPQVFPAEVTALRAPGGGVQRDAFEEGFEQILEGLGLGTALTADSAQGEPEEEEVENEEEAEEQAVQPEEDATESDDSTSSSEESSSEEASSEESSSEASSDSSSDADDTTSSSDSGRSRSGSSQTNTVPEWEWWNSQGVTW